jgi:thiol-disulfide isomerase/thioredoxin
LQELKHSYDILSKPFPLKILEQQLRTPKGKTVSLAEVLAINEIVYISFWASWCKTCVDEMPALKQLMSELQGAAVKFVFVSFDDDEKKWQKAMAKLKVQGDHFLITEGFSSSIAKYISFNEIPRYVILDKKGFLINQQAPRPIKLLENKSDLLTLVR